MRLLLVEDNTALREPLAQSLREAGYGCAACDERVQVAPTPRPWFMRALR